MNLSLLLDMKHGVTLAPASAILRDAQSTFAWVIQPDDTATRRVVLVGTLDGDRVEIKSGLSPGETIASDEFNKLREGQKVHYRLAPEAGPAQTGSPANK